MGCCQNCDGHEYRFNSQGSEGNVGEQQNYQKPFEKNDKFELFQSRDCTNTGFSGQNPPTADRLFNNSNLSNPKAKDSQKSPTFQHGSNYSFKKNNDQTENGSAVQSPEHPYSKRNIEFKSNTSLSLEADCNHKEDALEKQIEKQKELEKLEEEKKKQIERENEKERLREIEIEKLKQKRKLREEKASEEKTEENRFSEKSTKIKDFAAKIEADMAKKRKESEDMLRRQMEAEKKSTKFETNNNSNDSSSQRANNFLRADFGEKDNKKSVSQNKPEINNQLFDKEEGQILQKKTANAMLGRIKKRLQNKINEIEKGEIDKEKSKSNIFLKAAALQEQLLRAGKKGEGRASSPAEARTENNVLDIINSKPVTGVSKKKKKLKSFDFDN